MANRQQRRAPEHSSSEGRSTLSDPDELLLASARNGDFQSLREALSAGASPDTRDEFGQTPLHLAAVYGHHACVRLLLPVSDPNTPDKNGRVAMHLAAQNGYCECVSLLLPVSDPETRDADGRTPLNLATGYGQRECITLIEGFLLARQESSELEWSAAPTVGPKFGRRL